MSKKAKGLFAGKKLKNRKRTFKWKRKGERSKKFKIYKKYDPLKGSPQAKGIVLEKVNIECKQPHSALRKCCKVQLIKNGKVVTAFVPGNHAIKFIDEHNEVVVERIGGPKRGSKGDIPGVKFKIIKVSNIALSQLISGKKEKPVR